jgi:hypothetical protein
VSEKRKSHASAGRARRRRVALDDADHGLPQGEQVDHGAREAGAHPRLQVGRAVLEAVFGREVVAGAEGPAFAAQHEHAHRVVAPHFLDQVDKAENHLRIERVELVRPIQRDVPMAPSISRRTGALSRFPSIGTPMPGIAAADYTSRSRP